MKIAIDISAIVYGTGVSVYTKELVRNLLKIDEKNEYILFGGSLRRKSEISSFLSGLDKKSFKGMAFPIPPTIADVLWNKLHKLPVETLIGKVDVFHSSDWTQPPSSAFRVTTIHDLNPFKFPELTPQKIIDVHKRRIKWVKKEIDMVIVPSHQIRDDLVKMGFDAGKIKVIYEAASSQMIKAQASDVQLAKGKYKLDKYILSVGVNPRKNTTNIVKAFDQIKKDTNLSLVLVGQPHAIHVEQNEKVKLLGHISDNELSALYTGAEVFVYPSLYEGFGIPILDAFKVGTPVVTSDLGSMKEVAGDAAVLVDPQSVVSIKKGIEKTIRDRTSLVKKGQEREKQFSWTKTARETLNVYEKAG